ncbi:MAG: hypothetical protein U5K73_04710 [Halofilum sp. (in: g-proteobacteria)]|nr:hypothetical protein [Halofilum sp. (in: g-proteobacteria)]
MLLNIRSARGLQKRLTVFRESRPNVFVPISNILSLIGLTFPICLNESKRKVDDNDLVRYRDTQGECIQTHQLRKLFANFALRVSPQLLSALQMHFHHVSQAMTDGGYRMSDPALLREVDDVRKQQAARLMLELIQDPDQHLAGSYGEQIEDRLRADLIPQVESKGTREAFVDVYAWVDDNDLHWYHQPHAICGAVAASEMACHQAAGNGAYRPLASSAKAQLRRKDPDHVRGMPQRHHVRTALAVLEIAVCGDDG